MPPPRASVHVRLLAFNDFHGALKTPDEQPLGPGQEVGGAAYLASHLRRLGASQDNTLVVAAGDLTGASQFASALFHDEPAIEVMNAAGLSVTSAGNHEFDRGLEHLLRLKNGGCHPTDGCRFEPNFAGAKFDVLAANLRTRGTATSPVPAYVVREVQGIPIAFVGMPLEKTPLSVAAPDRVGDLEFMDGVKTANALVPEIRNRGIEAIVLLIHQGGKVSSHGLDECSDLRGPIVEIVEKLDPAFDVVISGHTHALYNCRVGGRPVTSALSYGRAITSIDLTIDPVTRDVVRADAHNHWTTHDLEPDPAVRAIVERAATAAAPIESRVIGRITETLSAKLNAGGDSPLGAVIADAQLEATKKTGAQVALVKANRVEHDLVFSRQSGGGQEGAVTYGDAFAVQPWGNRLVTVTIAGSDLVTILERELKEESALHVSDGLVVRYGSSASHAHVTSLKLNGLAVAPESKVRVTTNEHFAAKDATLRHGTNKVIGPPDIEALEAYFAKHPKVAPPKGVRSSRQ
jgi:5'-nucleotidase